jgi:hypothetical protein
MPGCCLIAIVLFFGPRVLLAGAWVFSDWFRAFDSTLLALAGFLFLPWTTLAWMYTFFHGGSLSGLYAVLLIIGVIADLSAYGGGRHYRRWRERR